MFSNAERVLAGTVLVVWGVGWWVWVRRGREQNQHNIVISFPVSF